MSHTYRFFLIQTLMIKLFSLKLYDLRTSNDSFKVSIWTKAFIDIKMNNYVHLMVCVENRSMKT